MQSNFERKVLNSASGGQTLYAKRPMKIMVWLMTVSFEY